MIHAYLRVTQGKEYRLSHGPDFKKHMKRINTLHGSKITICHNFTKEVNKYRVHIYQCNGPCRFKKPLFGVIRRAIRRPPGPSNKWWITHQRSCGGIFKKIKESDIKTDVTITKSKAKPLNNSNNKTKLSNNSNITKTKLSNNNNITKTKLSNNSNNTKTKVSNNSNNTKTKVSNNSNKISSKPVNKLKKSAVDSRRKSFISGNAISTKKNKTFNSNEIEIINLEDNNKTLNSEKMNPINNTKPYSNNELEVVTTIKKKQDPKSGTVLLNTIGSTENIPLEKGCTLVSGKLDPSYVCRSKNINVERYIRRYRKATEYNNSCTSSGKQYSLVKLTDSENICKSNGENVIGQIKAIDNTNNNKQLINNIHKTVDTSNLVLCPVCNNSFESVELAKHQEACFGLSFDFGDDDFDLVDESESNEQLSSKDKKKSENFDTTTKTSDKSENFDTTTKTSDKSENFDTTIKTSETSETITCPYCKCDVLQGEYEFHISFCFDED